MSKKKLILNESVTRRFMKLASVKPMYVSNFLKEAEEDELEDPVGEEAPADEEPLEDEGAMEEDPMAAEEDPMADDMGMDEEPAEEDAEGEDMVMDFLKNAVMPWAEEKGVSMELAGDEEAEDDMGEEAGMEDELGDDMGEEEPMGDEGAEDELAPEGGEEGEEPADDEMLANRYQENLVREVTRRVAARLLREAKK